MTAVFTPDRILDDAADLLDATGWCRGSEFTAAGQHCLVGALRVAGNIDHSAYAKACQLLRVELGRGDYVSNFPLVFFNDTVAKDKRYVTRLLRRTARKLRSAVSS